MPVAIPIIVGAVSGAITGAEYGGLYYAIAGAVIGAGIGALGLLTQNRPGTFRASNNEIAVTTSIRNLPVPVVFGKARMGGNYLQLGRFYTIKDNHSDTPGRRLQIMHAAVGICEGQCQFITNIFLDGKTLADQAKAEKLPERYYVRAELGEPDEEVAPEFSAAGSIPSAPIVTRLGDVTTVTSQPPTLIAPGYQQKHQLAYRNTAKLLIEAIVGDTPRLADWNCDVNGPSLTIRRGHDTHEGNPGDTVRYAFYDGHTESYYAILNGSDVDPGPLGMVKMPREIGKRESTPPPDACSENILLGWYLGRNDVLVFQDPSQSSKFYIGTWGLARDSADWETIVLPEYEAAILGYCMDEYQGCLHTLHAGETNFYILKWNLLSGRITRIDTTRAVEDVPLGTSFQFLCDFNAYVMGILPNRVYLLDGDTGAQYVRTTKADLSKLRGFCVSGQRVGIITTNGLVYWAPNTGKMDGIWGDSSIGVESGAFGGISNANQNTWTGQVCMAKQYAGSAFYINFIPSVVVAENGKAGLNPSPKDGWARDWSHRSFNHYSLVLLQGQSSMAAAMWNSLVDEPNTDSGRWGGGMKRELFSLPSFESVHSYCVGGVMMLSTKGNEYYAERYRCDIAVDSERTVTDLLNTEFLVAINGFRIVQDGRLHVGVQRAALPLAWHFTDHQIADGKAQLTFIGRSTSPNRVRVEFVNIEDDFRRDFADANDEFDQNRRGRVLTSTITANAIGRMGHASLLAGSLLDMILSQRRQIQFTTSFLGLVLNPGDGIEVTSTPLGISRGKFRVSQISEQEDGSFQITGVEHSPPADMLKLTLDPSDGNDPTGCDALALSAEARIPLPDSVIHPAIYEYPDRNRLIPIAGVPLNAIYVQYVNVYWSKTNGEHDYHLMGTLTSSIGGFLPDDISATADLIAYDGQHGMPDDSLVSGDNPLPLIIGMPESPGTQGGVQETLLATRLEPFDQTFEVQRPNGMAWNAVDVEVARVVLVTGVTGDCGRETGMYRQARGYCADAGQGCEGASPDAPGAAPNLISNPGAEAGSCGDGLTTTGAPGWTTVSGNFTAICAGLYTYADAPEGSAFFGGGPASSDPAVAEQVIDVSAYADMIASGACFYFSAQLGTFGDGGASHQDDQPKVELFAGATLIATLGPKPGNVKNFQLYEARGNIPGGTTELIVRMTMTRDPAADPDQSNDGYVDDLKLHLCPGSDGLAVDLWLPVSEIPYYPYYVYAGGTCYRFIEGDPASPTHGTILTDYEVIAGDDPRCCAPPDADAVPCTAPTGLSSSYTASFHFRGRFGDGDGVRSDMIRGECDVVTTIPADPAVADPLSWRPTDTAWCPFTCFDDGGHELPDPCFTGALFVVNWINPGDGSPCYWQFISGNELCRVELRKYTGSTPVGVYAFFDASVPVEPDDGNCRCVCADEWYDTFTSVRIS